ncbi:hypothetical protein [Actinoplanes teichomyceticus]|uniref:hypothetical protein n=1 Tax=Actinoplanes teichomyceticus TaxID=1867 RepID=UPI0013DE6746|nr:hypothetical protein [Actinoplanes teichomyceticus]
MPELGAGCGEPGGIGVRHVPAPGRAAGGRGRGPAAAGLRGGGRHGLVLPDAQALVRGRGDLLPHDLVAMLDVGAGWRGRLVVAGEGWCPAATMAALNASKFVSPAIHRPAPGRLSR